MSDAWGGSWGSPSAWGVSWGAGPAVIATITFAAQFAYAQVSSVQLPSVQPQSSQFAYVQTVGLGFSQR